MSTKRKKRRYTREFKEEALRVFANRGERTVAEVAKGLGVSESMLYAWKGRGANVSPASDRGETAEQELARLRRENQDLKKERDVLVKSIAVFVRERR